MIIEGKWVLLPATETDKIKSNDQLTSIKLSDLGEVRELVEISDYLGVEVVDYSEVQVTDGPRHIVSFYKEEVSEYFKFTDGEVNWNYLRLTHKGKSIGESIIDENDDRIVAFGISSDYSGEVIDIEYDNVIHGQIILADLYDKEYASDVEQGAAGYAIDFFNKETETLNGDVLSSVFTYSIVSAKNDGSGEVYLTDGWDGLYYGSSIDGSPIVTNGGRVPDARFDEFGDKPIPAFKLMEQTPFGAGMVQLALNGRAVEGYVVSTLQPNRVNRLPVEYNRELTPEEQARVAELISIEGLVDNDYLYTTVVPSASTVELYDIPGNKSRVYVKLQAGASDMKGSLLGPYIMGNVRLIDRHTYKAIPTKPVVQDRVHEGIYSIEVDIDENIYPDAIVAVGGVGFLELGISLTVKDEEPIDPSELFKVRRLDAELKAKLPSGLNQYRIYTQIDMLDIKSKEYKPYTGEEITFVDEMNNALNGTVILEERVNNTYVYIFTPRVGGTTGARVKVEGRILEEAITLSLGELELGEVPDYEYPLDEYGTNPKNFIKGEYHTVSSISYKDYFLLIPKASPFYENDFLVRYKSADYPEFRVLKEGVDYSFVMDYVEASSAFRKVVYGGIIIHNLDLSGIIEINYRTLGGPHVANPKRVINTIIENVYNPTEIYWSWVTDVPPILPPEEHEHDLMEVKNIRDVIDAINSISTNIVEGGQMVKEAHTEFLSNFNVKLFNRIMMDMLDNPWNSVMAHVNAVKRRLYNIESGLIQKQQSITQTDRLAFGVVYQVILKEPLEGCFFLDGKTFDRASNPGLSALYPSGRFPDIKDTTGNGLKHMVVGG